MYSLPREKHGKVARQPRNSLSLLKKTESPEHERLFFKGSEFYEALEFDLNLAYFTIDIEMYIWSNDEIGNRFFVLLEAAAARGVQVRVVLDGVGSWFWLRANQEKIINTPVNLRVFCPLRWNLLRKIPDGLSRCFSKLNRRNHKKVIIIDETVAYTGSMNITRSSLYWKECGLRLGGNAVPLLLALFEDVWSQAGDTPRRDYTRGYWLQQLLLKSEVIRSNQFYQLRRERLRDLKFRIKHAQRRTWMMTPYFVPPFGLFLSLLKAARRGVDVCLILPRKSDISCLRWIARLYYRYLLRAGVKVYEYLPEVLHAKISLIDNWGFVGSSNLNRRSSFLDLELDAAGTIIGGEWYSNAHPDFIWTHDAQLQARSPYDAEVIADPWTPSQPVPASWAGPAAKASERGAPLYTFLSRLLQSEAPEER